jgi:hypothetical protein
MINPATIQTLDLFITANLLSQQSNKPGRFNNSSKAWQALTRAASTDIVKSNLNRSAMPAAFSPETIETLLPAKPMHSATVPAIWPER